MIPENNVATFRYNVPYWATTVLANGCYCVLMGIFAPNFGAAIIQRTGWQETTKHLHGSLPKYWYQRKLTVSGSKEVFEEPQNKETHEEVPEYSSTASKQENDTL